MVRAILAGSKTQTRRVVKGMALDWLRPGVFSSAFVAEPANGLCPYGQPGDRLWVRETFQRFTDDGEVLYKADPKSFDAMNELKRDECLEARWRPAIHMPRTVSRITLEVSSIRVEPLQDISEADCVAEGVGALPMETRRATPRSDFNALWESINGPGSWEANPWVWVVGFNRLP
jgi:hypothetical protein